MRLLYIMDPVESIIPDKDTTLAFLDGGQRRGHENFHAEPSQIYLTRGELRARARRVRVHGQAPFVTLDAETVDLGAADCSAILVRKDPPFDQSYLYTTLLLEHARGKTLLINIWATWCAPCREEMPTLDKLQAKLGSKDFEVVIINIDTARRERAPAFLKEIGVKNLAFYSDPKAEAFYKLKSAGKATGLPTTYLVGKDGCEIATLAGPANWASDEALALIRAAL